MYVSKRLTAGGLHTAAARPPRNSGPAGSGRNSRTSGNQPPRPQRPAAAAAPIQRSSAPAPDVKPRRSSGLLGHGKSVPMAAVLAAGPAAECFLAHSALAAHGNRTPRGRSSAPTSLKIGDHNQLRRALRTISNASRLSRTASVTLHRLPQPRASRPQSLVPRTGSPAVANRSLDDTAAVAAGGDQRDHDRAHKRSRLPVSSVIDVADSPASPAAPRGHLASPDAKKPAAPPTTACPPADPPAPGAPTPAWQTDASFDPGSPVGAPPRAASRRRPRASSAHGPLAASCIGAAAAAATTTTPQSSPSVPTPPDGPPAPSTATTATAAPRSVTSVSPSPISAPTVPNASAPATISAATPTAPDGHTRGGTL